MKTKLTKFFSGLALTLILASAAFLLSYLRVAFGWTNPDQAPPGGSGALTVDSSGNVGIGIATPSQKLSVQGMIESLSGGIKFPDGTTQATNPWTYDSDIKTNKKVGIGGNIPSSQFEVTGNIKVTGKLISECTTLSAYIGRTVASFDGNDAGSYASADGKCEADFPGGTDATAGHVCSIEEISRSIRCNLFNVATEDGWYNSYTRIVTPDSSGTNRVASDCANWASVGGYGLRWDAGNKRSTAALCNNAFRYLCCK